LASAEFTAAVDPWLIVSHFLEGQLASSKQEGAAGDGRTDLHRMAMRRASAQVGPPEEAPEELVFLTQFAAPLAGLWSRTGSSPRDPGPCEAAAGLRRDYCACGVKTVRVGKWCPGLRLCAGLPLGAPWQVAREYIVVVLGALVASDIMANALSPC
jgi:hypothetical protein